VEDERKPLRRRRRFQHDEHREADRVREQRLVGRVCAIRRIDDRIRDAHVEGLLAAGAP
jgi:hypothetical protein